MPCMRSVFALPSVICCPCRGDEDEPPAVREVRRDVRVVIDGWLSMKVPVAALPPLHLLRQRMRACFAAKVGFFCA